MSPRNDSPYDDEPTAEELAQMEEDERKRGLPEPDDSSQQQPAAEPGDEGDDDELDEDGEPKPKPAAQEPAPKVEGEEEEEEEGDDKLAGFLAKHQGKTPEELVKLAFQQQQRAARAEFDQRKTSENLSTVLARIQQARDARVNKTAEERAAFEAKLKDDPDAAVLEAREAQLAERQQAELAELDAEEFNARATAAIELASAAIPEFQKRAPGIRSFGVELGFSPEEVGQMVDGRQIVGLYLASIAGNMIKAGIIDTSGRFLKLPQPVEEPTDGQQEQGKRRGTGFGRQPARGAQGAKTLEARLAEAASMTDEEFDKLDPKALEELLREVEAS